MNDVRRLDTPPSGDKLYHPLINNFKESETFGYHGNQHFIAPHHLAPFSCTSCSSSSSNYADLIKAEVLNSIVDISNSLYDISQEIDLILKANEKYQNATTILIPDAEYLLTIDVPDNSRTHMKAKINNIGKASPELGLSKHEWLLLSEEGNG